MGWRVITSRSFVQKHAHKNAPNGREFTTLLDRSLHDVEFRNGNPLLCGGTGGLNNSCLEYIPSSDTWVDPGYTIRERGIFNPSSAEISGGRWWVCGGTGVSKSFMNNLDFA